MMRGDASFPPQQPKKVGETHYRRWIAKGLGLISFPAIAPEGPLANARVIARVQLA